MSKQDKYEYAEAGERLRAFKDAVFKRSYEFAYALQMDQPSIYRYMRGENLLGGVKLILLHGLGCNIVWYLTGEGAMFSDSPAGLELRLNSVRASKNGGEA